MKNATEHTVESSGLSNTSLTDWYTYIDTTNFEDGSYTFNVTAQDKSQYFANINDTEKISITIDNTPPQVNITYPQNNSVWRQNVTFNITINDEHPDYSTYKYNLSNSTWNSGWLTLQNTSLTDWFTTLNTSLYKDGAYKFEVIANDIRDNSNNTESITVKFDNTNPEVTPYPTTYPIYPTSDINQTWAKIGDTLKLKANIIDNLAGVKNNVTVNATEIGTGYVPVPLTEGSSMNGNYTNNSVIVGSSQNGIHNLAVFAYDIAGNLNNTKTIEVRIDNSNPDVKITSPADNANISGNLKVNATLIDIGSAGICGACYNLTNSTNSLVYEMVKEGSTDYYLNTTLNTLTLSDGHYNVTIIARDWANNINSTELAKITVDNTKAIISIDYPEQGQIVKENVTINAAINDTLTGIISYNATISGIAVSTFTCSGNLNNKTCTGTFNTTEQGWNEVDKSIIVTAKDYAGNINSTSIDVSVDNQNPRVNIINPEQNARISQNYTFNITINDTNGNISTYKYKLSNSSGDIISWTDLNGAGTGWYTIIQTESYTEGWYNFSINTSDKIGHINDTEFITIQIDNKPPEITFSYPLNSKANNNITLNVTITDSEGNGKISTYKWEMLKTSDLSTEISINTFTSNQSDHWLENITTTSHPDGNYTIKVYASDIQNNNATKNTTIYIDNTPPTVKINNPQENKYYSNNMTLNVTINDTSGNDDSTTYRFEMYNSTPSLVLSDSFTISENDNFLYNITSTAYPDGTYNITIFANDTLNNQNSTETISFRIDNTPPEVNITNPKNNSPIFGYFVFNITIEDTLNNGNYSDYNYYLKNITIIESGYLENTSLTEWYIYVNTSKYIEGNYTFGINAIDTLGNLNNTEINIVIDNNPSNITIETPPENKVVRKKIWFNVTITDSGVGVNSSTVEWYNSTQWRNFTWQEESKYYTQINTTKYNDGQLTLKVRANDTINRKSEANVTIVVDNTLPLIIIDYPCRYYVKFDTLHINGTIYDNNTKDYSPQINDTDFELSTFNSSTGTFSFRNKSTIPDGNISLNISFVDDAGNYNETIISFVADNTPPLAWGGSPTGTFQKNVDVPVTFKVNATDNINLSHVELSAEHCPSKTPTGGNITNMTCEGGTLYNYTETPMYFGVTSNGAYYMVAKAVDEAGNINITRWNVIVDDLPPTVDSYNITPFVETKHQNATIRILMIDNNVVEWARINITYTTDSSITLNESMYNITTLHEENVIFEYNFTPPTSGVYNISVWGFDGATIAEPLYIGSFTAIGTTRGTLKVSDTYVTTYNITQSESQSFMITLNLTNIGSDINNSVGTMYTPQLVISNLYNGITSDIQSYTTCTSKLPIEDTCNITFNITVNANANLGTPLKNRLAASARWVDPQNDTYEFSSYLGELIIINVTSNPELVIIQDNLEDYNLIYNTTRFIGNFTIYSFGNDNLTGITYNITEGNLSQDWILFSPQNITLLERSLKANVSVNITPDTRGYFTAKVTSNATGTMCYTEDRCYDTLNISIISYDYALLNLTYPVVRNTFNRSEENIAINCSITNNSFNEGIANYALNYSVIVPNGTTILLNTTSTDSQGNSTYSFNTTNVSVGNYTFICDITDSKEEFYLAMENEDIRNITLTLMGELTINMLNSKSDIYWYDTHPDHNTTFSANVTDEFKNAVNGSIIRFYSNNSIPLQFTEIGNCTTNNSGLCEFTWNPDVNKPFTAKVFFNATMDAYYYNTSTGNISITINGGLSVNIKSPPNNTDVFIGEKILLNASTLDGSGQEQEPPEINWTMDYNTSDILSTNKTSNWTVESYRSLGRHNITATVSNGTAATNTTHTIYIFDYATISLTEVSSYTTPRYDGNINFSADVRNNRTGASIGNYSCKWYHNTEHMENTLTNASGTCMYTWTPDCSNYVGNHTITVKISEIRNDTNSAYYKPLEGSGNESAVITLTETLIPTIIHPDADESFMHKTDNITLFVNITDKCGEVQNATVNWTLANQTFIWPNTYYNKSISQNLSCSWYIADNHSRGPFILNATVGKENYTSNFTYTTIQIYGIASANTTLAPDYTNYSRSTNIKISCLVYDKNQTNNAGIPNYNVSITNTYLNESGNLTEVELCSNSTNSSGYVTYLWDTSSETLGNHNISCIINDSNVLYYNKSDTTKKEIDIQDELNITLISKTYNLIYRDDKYNNESDVTTPLKTNTTLSVNVSNQYLDSVENVTILFYYNSSKAGMNYFGNCITNSNGLCNITWNPSGDVAPDNYNVVYIGTKDNHYNSTPQNTPVQVRAHSMPEWIHPTEPVYVDMSNDSVSYNPLNVICSVNESYANKSIAYYPLEIWWGDYVKDWEDQMDNETGWVPYSGECNLSGTGGITSIQTNTSCTVRTTNNELNLTNYERIQIYVTNISSNTTWTLKVNNGTWISIIENSTEVGLIDKKIVVDEIKEVAIKLNNETNNGISTIDIDWIIIKSNQLENTTEIMNTEILDHSDVSGAGDMENIAITNGNPPPVSTGWYVTNAIGSTTDITNFTRQGNKSMKINITNLDSSGPNSRITREYFPYEDLLQYKRLSFWIYRPENMTNAQINFSLTEADAVGDDLCTYSYDLGNWSEWKYFQPHLSEFSSNCSGNALRQVGKYGFIIANMANVTVSGIIYIDDIRGMTNLSTNENGLGTAEWIIPRTGSFDMMCRIDDNLLLGYNASKTKVFTTIELLRGGEEGEEEEDNQGSPPGTDEGMNIGANVTSFTRLPENMSGIIATNNIGAIGEIKITSNYTEALTLNITVWGNGSDYINITNELGYVIKNITLAPLESKNITVTYSTKDSEGFYDVNISMWTYTTKDRLDTLVSFEIVQMAIEILSPTQTNPKTGIIPGDIIEIHLNTTYNHSPSGNFSLDVKFNSTPCTKLSSYYNSTGYWIVNCTAPKIDNNPINNSLIIYGTNNIDTVTDTEDNTIIYNNTLPPIFTRINATSSERYGNITIAIDTLDYSYTDSVWIRIININDNTAYANITLNLTNGTATNGTWTAKIINISKEGDYDIIIHANDTGNLNSSTIGWFDVYPKTNISGNISDVFNMTFTFYRPNINQSKDLISFSSTTTGYFNDIRKRIYDISIRLETTATFIEGTARQTHTLVFKHVNITTNLTNPVIFGYVNISNITAPSKANKIVTVLAGLSINTTGNFTYLGGLTLGLNYSEAPGLLDRPINTNNLHIYRCDNFNSSNCTAWNDIELTVMNQSNESTIAHITISHTSTYILTEESDIDEEEATEEATQTESSSSIALLTLNDTSKLNMTHNLTRNMTELQNITYPFSVSTNLIDIFMLENTSKEYHLKIKNNLDKNISVSIEFKDNLSAFVNLEKTHVTLEPKKTEKIIIYVKIPPNTTIGEYYGNIFITDGNYTENISSKLTVTLIKAQYIELKAVILTKYLHTIDTLKAEITLRDLRLNQDTPINMSYYLRRTTTDEIISKADEPIILRKFREYSIEMPVNVSKNNTGEYYLLVIAYLDDSIISATDTFEIKMPFWTGERLKASGLALGLIFISALLYYAHRWYLKKKLEKLRYLMPNYKKLPKKTDKTFWLGKIAETDMKAWFNPNELTTHVLTAGATGTGKSVSASIFVEEALKKGIPAIVFDPTVQWTGFVRPCKDKNLLNKYSEFNIKKEESKSFRGMIFEVEDPNVKIEFKKYMNPGEITIFTLNKLKAGEYDKAVESIVNTIFHEKWEESPDLKLLVVFDEVHRLLEKYGGKGGYLALEKACREFRKWGIGLIMCSQVSSDFKEAVQGNILTEIQMNTKSMEDIKKIEEKYGAEYAGRISREAVGVGMIQNPKYNDGKPWFIQFRPTLHSPHKILENELEQYNKFASMLEEIEGKIEVLKKTKDTFDIELELKLAKNKLKEGRFKMAEIYITSLKGKLKGISWKE